MWAALSSQPWLVGALLSVGSSALGLTGMALQKAAQHHVADARPRRRAKPRLRGAAEDAQEEGVTLQELLRSPCWWSGLLLLAAHYPVTLLALSYAPETTVVSLKAVQVVLNSIVAYGLLFERFTRHDIWATLVCIGGMVIAVGSMPRNVPGYMQNFPTDQFMAFLDSLFSSTEMNEGFELYLLSWLVLLAVCAYLLKSVSLAEVPFALPMLVGLFTSQFHFVAKLAGTLAHRSADHPEVWVSATYWVMVTTGVLFVISVCVTSEGLRHLDCRYFVPAAFAAETVLTVAQGLFFFREWQLMSRFDLVFFTFGCAVSFAGALFVSPQPARVSMVQPSSPLLPQEEREAIKVQEAALAIMQEHRMLKRNAVNPKPLSVVDLHDAPPGFWSVLRVVWQFVPIASCIGVVVLCVALYQQNFTFLAFWILTLWGAHNGWKYGLHMALFSYVGQMKMAQYDEVDFLTLHDLVQQDLREAGRIGPRWEEVRHYVMLPNYKEDIEVLRLALKSIAASRIAKTQIGVVLAMEAREAGARDKVERLQREFSSLFWQCIATYHEIAPGETPGKSSNTRHAAQQVLDVELPRLFIDPSNVVLTVADADSQFHTQYFDALTFHFVHAGGQEDETPDRYLSVFQPPILHYKNYLTQPAIVRLASLFTSQHELANMSDPNAVRVPYSTYSISAVLVQAVRGWDPDWISEDWHMGIKCFLATAGRYRITPIFLAVMNYAPEGDTYCETIGARWAQCKRHALGFSELVFFMDHFPRVLFQIRGRWEQAVFIWRAFFLWSRCLLIHLTMATMFAIGSTTALLIATFLQNRMFEDVNSWTFLTYIVFQTTGLSSVVLFMFTNVLLFDLVLARVDGGLEPSVPLTFRSRGLHFLYVGLTAFLVLPWFFAAAGMAEWIAAIKTARTHKFKYEVALKPNLSKDAVQSA